MKFDRKEIKFLQKHKEDFEAGNFDNILKDYSAFGSYQKLTTVIKELQGLDFNPIFNMNKKTTPKFNFESIRFPSVKDIQQLPKDLQIYRTTSSWYYFTSTIIDNDRNRIYLISDEGNIISRTGQNTSGYRPIMVIPNLVEIKPELKVGDSISFDLGELGPYGLNNNDIGGVQPWLVINDHEVIYNGELINQYFNNSYKDYTYEGSIAQEICEKMLGNIRKLNK